jgi:acyl carrier protein
MNENLKNYQLAFTETLGVTENQLENLKYQDIPEWDSIGHMGLMSSLEDSFKIEMEIDDIIDFSSYQKGIEILGKYNISLKD